MRLLMFFIAEMTRWLSQPMEGDLGNKPGFFVH